MWETIETVEDDECGIEVEMESPEVIRVRKRLEDYAAKANTRLVNIEAYVNLFKAIELSGKSRQDLFYIIKAYKELTGEDLPKATAHMRIKKMKDVGI
jgi:hypothetical protein